MWDDIERLVRARNLNERVIPALFEATMRLRVRSATYRASLEEDGLEVTEQMASRDLRQLTDDGLLVALGEKSGRFYRAGKELLEIRKAIVEARDPRDDSDPFSERYGRGRAWQTHRV